RSYYRSPDESIAAFVRRGLTNEFNLFSPVALSSTNAAGQILVFALMAIGVYGMWRLFRKEDEWYVAAAPALMSILLAGELLAAAIVRRYPFGGHPRHQFLLFPFVIM